MARLLLFTILLLAIGVRLASADVTYEILRDTNVPGIKRSLVVRLSERVDEAELRKIAMKLKALDPQPYQRTFIGYYLLGMVPGAGAWATSHFNPKLEVNIFGMSREQEDALATETDSRALGTWADRGIVAAVVTIERSSNGLIMRQRFKDGSESETFLKEAYEPQPGKRYHYKAGSSTGEHIRINQAGDLEFWDQDGLISNAKKR